MMGGAALLGHGAAQAQGAHDAHHAPGEALSRQAQRQAGRLVLCHTDLLNNALLDDRGLTPSLGGKAGLDAAVSALVAQAGAVRQHQHHASRGPDGQLRVAPIVIA